ncbi:hypothetical protein GGI25_005213 [Coemansia spiralis]|uniref:SH3 domain-containing protein n=2 Tax=Coemansia TaxID=4863 RepID=A0A9W8G4Z8_9FUNG|nr:hypothetical protein BX070DRAFT_255280 [Coemansia spiralis]KAJ1995611.1 hypothetical protein EDC05_000849 [Coemansia umbellata]KAJ2625058.1 hypothetical protein GGI26_000861 [Coemansia sp. RSA 1358]KAJ2672181.1 hypothetical protein GGI25_005213 [Coemansia spiralis]
MLAYQPTPQPSSLLQAAAAGGLPKYSLHEPAHHSLHPLIVYLSNSIRRDVRLLAAMGVIKEQGVKVISSHLPYAATAASTAASVEEEEDAILKALSLSASACSLPLQSPESIARSPASTAKDVASLSQSMTSLPKGATVGDASRAVAQAKTLNRQRSETAPLRPMQQPKQPQTSQPSQPSQQPPHQQALRASGSPRKEKQHRHEGFGAKLGAFFNKLTLDSETSPRARGAKAGSITPASSPRALSGSQPPRHASAGSAKVPFPHSPGTLSFVCSESSLVIAADAPRAHERSLSDTPHTPQLAQLAVTAHAAPKLPHRVTVSHCPAPPGIASVRHQHLVAAQDPHQLRKPSQGSQRSGASASGVSTGSAQSSESSTLASGRNTAASNRSSNRSSGASTLANRKRSFTHLGLSMESLPAVEQKHQQQLQPISPLSSCSPRDLQLRRAKPTTNIASLQAKLVSPGAISEGMARLAAPSNSLGLVLQSSSAAIAAKPKPLSASIRAQRHHSSFSVVKEPKSPSSASRFNCGLSSIVQSRSGGGPSSSVCRSAAPSTLAFPPMPSDACQAAMLSGSAEQAEVDRRSQLTPPPNISRALSDSTMDKSLASMVLVATATYDYSSGIKGDLEFAKGERIVIQSKVNDDWWFGSILPEAGRGSTGRSGMFPRSHVAF